MHVFRNLPEKKLDMAAANTKFKWMNYLCKYLGR